MVKRALHLCVLAAALAAVASAPAYAQDPNHIKMEADLSGGEETPAAINTGAFGRAEVGIDMPNREIVVDLQVFNLPTGTTAGHIHAGSRGTPGPVILDFLLPTNRAGDFRMSIRLNQSSLRARPEIGINTMDDALQAVSAGNAYVNIHTSQYPGGEIRGQLRRMVEP
jgi:hypothetical protein